MNPKDSTCIKCGKCAEGCTKDRQPTLLEMPRTIRIFLADHTELILAMINQQAENLSRKLDCTIVIIPCDSPPQAFQAFAHSHAETKPHILLCAARTNSVYSGALELFGSLSAIGEEARLSYFTVDSERCQTFKDAVEKATTSKVFEGPCFVKGTKFLEEVLEHHQLVKA